MKGTSHGTPFPEYYTFRVKNTLVQTRWTFRYVKTRPAAVKVKMASTFQRMRVLKDTRGCIDSSPCVYCIYTYIVNAVITAVKALVIDC